MVKLLACPDPDQLRAIAVGVLPSGGAEDLIEHLEQCANCATRLSAITADDPLVAAVRAKQAVADSKDQQAVSGLVAKVRALVATPKSTDPTLDSAASAGLSGDTGAFSWMDQPAPPEPEDDGLAPPLAADELGRLGPYRVLKVLGEGGMGKVFLAEDPNLQRFVALKMMKASVAKNPNARQRFLREARLAAKIEHDHIVHIYQVGEDRGIPFMAMQLLKGASLEDLLNRCRVLNVKQVLRIGIQTAQGLAAAHEHGMIHRDIKPGNIWIEPTGGGRVKILDFGLARISQGDTGITQSGTILGTPAYMPPEQARGEKVDQRCDLYSLGCVMYRMATGELPLKGNDTMSMLMALALQEPIAPIKLNPEIPQALSDLIVKLLVKDADRRIGSAKEVVQALKAIERGNNVPAPGDTAVLSASMLQPPTSLSTAALISPANPYGHLKTESEQKAMPWPTPAGKKSRLTIAALLLLGLLAGGSFAGMVLYWQTNNGVIRVEINDPDITLAFDKDGPIFQGVDKQEIKVKVGEHGLLVKRGDLEFPTEKFILKRGEKITLKVEWLKGGKLQVVQGDKVIGEQSQTKLAALDPAWFKLVAALPAEQQVKAVAAKLKERNPGFDGTIMTHKIDKNGVVTEFEFSADKVTDLAPVQALVGLEYLRCNGSAPGEGRRADLSPLKDMKLINLSVYFTQVSDLSPLKGIKLGYLNCEATQVSDLSPLKDMKLWSAHVGVNKIADLSPLKGMPLAHLRCDFEPQRDAAILRSITTLKTLVLPTFLWARIVGRVI